MNTLLGPSSTCVCVCVFLRVGQTACVLSIKPFHSIPVITHHIPTCVPTQCRAARLMAALGSVGPKAYAHCREMRERERMDDER